MNREQCCVLIPSLSPDEKLPAYVEELIKAQDENAVLRLQMQKAREK